MIAQLKGQLLSQSIQKDHAQIVMDVNGVGYEVHVGLNALPKLRGHDPLTLFTCQTATPYDGATLLYGFPTREEKEIFLQLKEHVPGVGPKKALESVDRITKSLPDFKRAVIENDLKLLVGVFGFSRKTAEKLVYSLKDRMETFAPGAREKWGASPRADQDAVSALVAIGYTERQAREAIREVVEGRASPLPTADLLKAALRHLAGRPAAPSR